MDYLDLLLRWAHILSAVALLGGAFFLRWVLAPALASTDDTTRESVSSEVRSRWARIVMVATALLLLSGIINAVRILQRYDVAGPYHMLVGVKLLLALVVFWLAARLVGRSSAAARFRERQGLWLSLNVALGITIVCLAGVMKMSDRSPKTPSDAGDSTVIAKADTLPER